MSANRNAMLALALAKLETTPGTDAVPSPTADALLLVDPIPSPGGDFAFRTDRKKVVTGAIQSSPPLKPQGRVNAWPLKLHARGTRAGTAYAVGNVPEPDVLLQMGGLSQTLVTTAGLETVTYKPASSSLKNATLYYYVDGSLRKSLGAVADTLTFDFSAGGPLLIEAATNGLYQGQTDVALPTTQVFGTSVAPTVDNVTLSINAITTGIIRSFKCVCKNTATGPRANANAVGALVPPEIRQRDITFTIVLENPLVADQAFEALQIANTGIVISWAIAGVQYAGAISWLSNNAHIEKVTLGQDKETEIVTLEGGFYDSAFGANDAFALKFA